MTVVTGCPVPAELCESQVLTRDGEPAVLGSLFEGRAALLVWLRHFGCIGCSEQIAELEPRLSQLHELGMRTILIGNGDAAFIAEFIRRHNLTDKKVVVVTDPSLRVFELLELRRTFWSAWGLRALWGALRAKGRGLSGYRGPGDTYQQGGALVVDADGMVQFVYRNRFLSDRADTNDVVDTAMRVLYRAHSDQKGLV